MIKKYRWSRDYESNEEELLQLLQARHYTSERWVATEQTEFASHSHDYDHKLWCAEGSMIFTIAGQRISLQPGDALDIPAGTDHASQAGISGCVCYVHTVDSGN